MARKSNLPAGPGPGRPPGVPNKATTAMKDISRAILEQPEAIDVLKRQARAGRLNPQIHVALMHYAYGKPKDTTEVTGAGGGPLLVGWLKPSDREGA